MKAPSEKHLEDWIVANFNRFGFPMEASGSYEGEPDSYWLNEDEFIAPFFHEIIARQMPLPHGIVDLLVADNHMIHVVELKKGSIDAAAVVQCIRYVSDLTITVRDIAENRPPPTGINEHWWEQAYSDYFLEPLVSGYVVGYDIEDKRLCAVLCEHDMGIITYDYDATNDSYSFEFQTPYGEVHKRRNIFQMTPSHMQRIESAAMNILTNRAAIAKRSQKAVDDE